MTTGALPRSTHVLIVGGGPAGTSTAWHCAQAGLDVVLLDRAHFPRPKPCAEYVSPEGARLLSAMGALETLEARAAALTGLVVTAPSGAQIRGEFVAQHGFRGFRDRGLGIRRELLDTVLVERARVAGVQVVEGAKVDDLRRDAAGRICGVRVRTDVGVTEVSASIVIGADGLRSVVARRAGLAHTSRWPKRVAVVAHYRGVSGMTSLGEMHVTHNGYVGLATVDDQLTNVALVVSAHRAREMAGDPEAFLRHWLESQPTLAPRFRAAHRVSPARATGPFASRARRAWNPGVALVGDAADFYDPFTGEGIYAALRGGELLAPFVVDALHATSSSAEARALGAYERARRESFAGKWRVEKLIGLGVAAPALMNAAAHVLGDDRALSDLLIGVTGDFVPASALLAPRALGRLALGLARGAVSPWFSRPTPAHAPGHVHRS